MPAPQRKLKLFVLYTHKAKFPKFGKLYLQTIRQANNFS